MNDAAVTYKSLSLGELELRAVAGNIDAIAEMGRRLLASPSSTEADIQKAFAYVTRASEAGHAKAQNNLGLCYARGKGVARDVAQAVSCYRLAAKQGIPQAIFNLGLMYSSDSAAGYKPNRARRYFMLAADRGHSRAKVYVADMYISGIDVKPDPAKAISLLSEAAQSIDVGYDVGWPAKSLHSQMRLLFLHRIVADDVYKKEIILKAFDILTSAADHGNAFAQYLLADAYFRGIGIEKDKEQGMTWLEASANQNFPDAQHLLGELLFRDAATTERALSLIDAAAAQGHWAAKSFIDGQFGLYSRELLERRNAPSASAHRPPDPVVEYFMKYPRPGEKS